MRSMAALLIAAAASDLQNTSSGLWFGMESRASAQAPKARGNPTRSLIRRLYYACSAGAVVGAVSGFVDGLATVSRSVVAPQFTLLCFTAPILLNTALLCVLSLPFAAIAWLRRVQPDESAGHVAAQLLGTAAALWAVFWWADVERRARQGGGGGFLFFLALVPLFALAFGICVVMRRSLAQLEPSLLARSITRSAMAGLVLNLILVVPLTLTVFREGRQFLFDNIHGRA